MALYREFIRLMTEPGYVPSTSLLAGTMFACLSVAWGCMWFALMWLMPALPQAL